MPKIPPPAYLAAGLLVQHVLAPRRPTGRLRRSAATALALGAAGLFAGAARGFHARHTTVDPFDPARASTLVTDGVYRLTRNPMYVGMAGLLAAHAVARGGWLTPLPAAAFVAVIDRVQIPAEEAALVGNFGEPYDVYRSTVPRWVGST
jgi:protein-S-isoprenylcysteine O-methyltransferase Ste14